MSSNTITFPSATLRSTASGSLLSTGAKVDANLFFQEIYPQLRTFLLQDKFNEVKNIFNGNVFSKFSVHRDDWSKAVEEIFVGSMLDGSLDDITRKNCEKKYRSLEILFAFVEPMFWSLGNRIPRAWSDMERGAQSVYSDRPINLDLLIPPKPIDPFWKITRLIPKDAYKKFSDPEAFSNFRRGMKEIENPEGNDPKDKKS